MKKRESQKNTSEFNCIENFICASPELPPMGYTVLEGKVIIITDKRTACQLLSGLKRDTLPS